MARVFTYKDDRKTGTKFNLYEGTGSPENEQAGSVGDLYVRLDGGSATILYIKESGTNDTNGWYPVRTTSGGSGAVSGYDEEFFTATNGQASFEPTFLIETTTVLEVEENGLRKYETQDWYRDTAENQVVFYSGRQTGQIIVIRKWS